VSPAHHEQPGAASLEAGARAAAGCCLGRTHVERMLKEPQVLPRRRKHLAGLRGSSGTNSTAAYST
ncbi:unnamed protein product, partial [Closterium sp. Yama58-4]